MRQSQPDLLEYHHTNKTKYSWTTCITPNSLNMILPMLITEIG